MPAADDHTMKQWVCWGCCDGVGFKIGLRKQWFKKEISDRSIWVSGKIGRLVETFISSLVSVSLVEAYEWQARGVLACRGGWKKRGRKKKKKTSLIETFLIYNFGFCLLKFYKSGTLVEF